MLKIVKKLTLMLASMENPQKQMRAKPRLTRMPTQSPIERRSPHSHSGPNFPRRTSKTCILQSGKWTSQTSLLTELLLSSDLNLPEVEQE